MEISILLIEEYLDMPDLLAHLREFWGKVFLREIYY